MNTREPYMAMLGTFVAQTRSLLSLPAMELLALEFVGPTRLVRLVLGPQIGRRLALALIWSVLQA